LVTFKGSPLDIQLTGGVNGLITVRMKVGAYFNEGQGEIIE